MANSQSIEYPKNNKENGVECPIPGCEYAGSPRSVEAHISAKMDEKHKGEVGRSTATSYVIETGHVGTGGDKDRDVAEKHATEVERVVLPCT